MTDKTYKSEFLNILKERGFIHQCSDFDALDAKLMEGPQSAYIGFDATAKSLHIGNLTGIMMLYWFQQTGHKAITLMGGGTSKIGDPSFKDEQRNLMDDATIDDNIANIQSTCFKQFLDYDGTSGVKHAAMMVNNNDWLDGLKYLEFLRDYGRYFTVNRMLSFDSVKQRLERESPLSLLEFNYMVMQGYDFLELHRRHGTILQMGGSDQWGNIINGVDLAHKSDRAQLFALTAPLLTTPDGKKMGKTVNGAVWLNAALLPPYDYYQYWRNVDDVMVGSLLRRFTILPMDEIRKLEALEGAEINEAKKILAFEATKICHGETAAQEAAATAAKVFEQGGVGDDLPSIEIDATRLGQGISVLDLFVETGLVESKGEAKRLIKGGGARINDNKIEDQDLSATNADLTDKGHIKLSAGKKKHALVKMKV
ncbi:MAG: tyrosine--tRNA ligase [Micavibrio sp.]|nr:tyrosine--tRNA ligase [Micavibrio sp.]|tara:strand:+ start:205 stop:1479 length:1275 start_codon:yes stop_codon:yes gene_type:complete